MSEKNLENSIEKEIYGAKFTRDIIILTTILICIIAGVYIMFINQRAGVIGQDQAQAVSSWIDEQYTIMEKYKTYIEAHPEMMDNPDTLVDYLYENSKDYHYIGVAFVCSKNWEQQMYSSDGWIPDEDYDLDNKDYYMDCLAQGDGLYMTEVYTDVVTGQICISVSLVLDVSGYEAVVGADIYLDDLVELMESTYHGAQYATLVVDGVIATDPKAAYAMTDDGGVALEDTIYSKIKTKGLIFSGTLAIAHVTTIEGTNWQIISVYKLTSILCLLIGLAVLIVVVPVILKI